MYLDDVQPGDVRTPLDKQRDSTCTAMESTPLKAAAGGPPPTFFSRAPPWSADARTWRTSQGGLLVIPGSHKSSFNNQSLLPDQDPEGQDKPYTLPANGYIDVHELALVLCAGLRGVLALGQVQARP